MKLTIIEAQRHIMEQRVPYVKMKLELPEEMQGELTRGAYIALRINDSDFVKQFGDASTYEVRGMEFEL